MAAVSEGAPTHGAIAHLLPPTYKQMITSWLDEDTPSFDYGGFVVGEDEAEARLLGKSEVSTTHTISSSEKTTPHVHRWRILMWALNAISRELWLECLSSTKSSNS